MIKFMKISIRKTMLIAESMPTRAVVKLIGNARVNGAYTQVTITKLLVYKKVNKITLI